MSAFEIIKPSNPKKKLANFALRFVALPLLVMIVFLTIFQLSSCRKENSLKKAASGNLTKSDDLRLSAEDLDAEMDTFIYQTLQVNPDFSEFEYEVQDGLLVFEAALNYNTVSSEEAYDTTIFVYTTNLSLDVSYDEDPEEFLMTDIDNNWQTFLDSAEAAVVSSTYDPVTAFNIVVDLEFSGNSEEWDHDATSIDVQMIVWVGFNTSNPNYACSYDGNDYWYPTDLYGAVTGGCGTNNGASGTGFLRCQYTLNYPCAPYEDCHFYSNVWQPQVFMTGYEGTLYSQCTGYRALYYGTSPSQCLTPTEMQCFTDGAMAIADGMNGGSAVISYLLFAYYPAPPANDMWWALQLAVGDCNSYDPPW